MKLMQVPAGKRVKVIGNDGATFEGTVCGNLITSPTEATDIAGTVIFICPENCRFVLRSSTHIISAISRDATVEVLE
jgi:hypothetical protein